MTNDYDSVPLRSNDRSSSAYRDSSSRALAEFDVGLLRTFLAVAELQSFSLAGRARHLTQSAISGHVRRLEELVGKPLLRRTSTGAVPTEAGQRFRERARAILSEIDTAIDEASRSSRAPTIRIALPEDVLDERFARGLGCARAAFPDAMFAVTLAPTCESLSEVGHRFDLAFATHASRPARGDVVRRDVLGWFGTSGPDTRLHVIGDPARCLLSELMASALSRTKRLWKLEVLGSPMMGLTLASNSNLLGVARRDALLARGIAPSRDLPKLPDVTLAAHWSRTRDRTVPKVAATLVASMREPLREAREQLFPDPRARTATRAAL